MEAIESPSTEDIRDFVPDRINKAQLTDEVMQVLSKDDEAAYLVYLKLCNRFGAGQRII